MLNSYSKEIDVTELAHAGVKGMKWGVRKKKPTPKVDKNGNPLTKAQQKELRKKQTRNSKLIVGGSAAAVVGGAYLANKASGGRLVNKLPTDTIRRGKAAAVKTATNVGSWSFTSGVSPANMAFVIGREFVYNFNQTR